MSPHRIFFYSAILFLTGVFLKSIELSSFILIISGVISFGILIYSFLRKRYKLLPFILLPVFIITGAVYYQWDHSNLLTKFLTSGSFNEDSIVVSNPKKEEGIQEFYIKPKNKDSKIIVQTRAYPLVEYGDEVKIEGDIQTVEGSSGYENFLHKNGVVARMYFPEKLEVIDKNKASNVKFFLYKIRNKSELIFQKLLPPLKSALINGLTLGGYSGFGDEFRDDMKKSGTTHLVALSGYNISILVWVCMAFFLYFFKRRTSIIITLFIIAGFVVMTGAESSVIRAAIMGSLVVAASYFGRLYDLKNSVVFAALIMVIFNPKVLVFDVGFQLSFLALLGIVYLKPHLDSLLGFKDQGFMAWKENLTVTTAAQIAVFPILMVNFEYFSLSSLIANVAILELIPITMALGFLILLLYIVSYPISLMLSWVVGIFLSIEIAIIKLFSSLSIPIVFNMNWVVVSIYYIVLILLIYFMDRRAYV